MDEFKIYMEDMRVVMDTKMVKIRQEFDVQYLRRCIDKKADDKEVAFALD